MTAEEKYLLALARLVRRGDARAAVQYRQVMDRPVRGMVRHALESGEAWTWVAAAAHREATRLRAAAGPDELDAEELFHRVAATVCDLVVERARGGARPDALLDTIHFGRDESILAAAH